MRNNYYDSDWKWVKEQESGGEPVSPRESAPYGAVYEGQSRGQSVPQNGQLPLPSEPVRDQVRQVIITSQDQLNSTPSIQQWSAPRPRKKKGRSGLPGCIICLMLLAALLGTVIYLQGGISMDNPLDGLWAFFGNGGYEDYGDYDDYYTEDWTEALGRTTIRLGAVGDGTVLNVVPISEEKLTAQEIYSKVNPSVVAIQVSQGDGYYSVGSGVVATSTGYIITNAHLIAGGRDAEVLFSDGTTRTASLIGYDSSYDLAVLKVNGAGLRAAEFGDSDGVRVGDITYAIGNPLGLELRGTFTDGIISAINRSVTSDNGTMTLIQTTAALNSGNSGGALINEAGQVIGITNMKMMSDEETIEGLGFAIPTKSVKEVVDQIIEKGYYDNGKPLLGVTVSTHVADMDTPSGAYVAAVESGSSAERQGIRVGDIIIEANGQTVSNLGELLAVKEGLSAGDTMTLKVWRNGEIHTIEIELLTRYQMEHPEAVVSRPKG